MKVISKLMQAIDQIEYVQETTLKASQTLSVLIRQLHDENNQLLAEQLEQALTEIHRRQQFEQWAGQTADSGVLVLERMEEQRTARMFLTCAEEDFEQSNYKTARTYAEMALDKLGMTRTGMLIYAKLYRVLGLCSLELGEIERGLAELQTAAESFKECGDIDSLSGLVMQVGRYVRGIDGLELFRIE